MLYIIIAILSIILSSLMYALGGSLKNFSRLKFEVEKRQERRFAIILEELLLKERELQFSLKTASDLFLVLFGASLFLALKENLLTAMLVALPSALILAKILPIIASNTNADFILENFIYLAKGAFIVFSPFAGKTVEQSKEESEESIEMEIIQNALDFSEVKVRECMIPRTEICAIEQNSSKEELLNRFMESKYSRLIVFNGSIDKITGYVHSKDLFSGNRDIGEIIRAIDFVPEDMGARELLASLIKNKRSLAVVNDEYGGTAGIVSLEDLIEEIFGEISDELDKEDLIEKKLSDTEFIFSARLEIKYLNREYSLELPDNADYETLGGLITWFNENIPAEGEILTYRNFEFTILKTSSNRLETVALRIVEQ